MWGIFILLPPPIEVLSQSWVTVWVCDSTVMEEQIRGVQLSVGTSSMPGTRPGSWHLGQRVLFYLFCTQML